MAESVLNNPAVEVLRGHRTIRRFEDRELPEGLLEELIECGQRASTSSNMQTYSVIHITDPDKRAQIAKLAGDQVQIHQCSDFLVFCADLHRDQLANTMQNADRFDGDYVEALLVSTVDAALLMQNVTVAAESAGLGICMIGAIRNNPKAVGKLLGLPSFVYAMSGLCVGYPAQDPECKPRLPVEAVLHVNQYQDDETQMRHIEAYDQTMTDFYSSQGMHDQDPRWSTVMANRTASIHNRVELDSYLPEQGFGLRSDT